MAIRQPFTADELFKLLQPTSRVPLHLSPDGKYLLMSVQGQKREKSTGHKSFTDTGISRPMMNSRVLLIDTMTGAVEEPFPEETSWGAQWSPDGSAIAAYVQQGQEQACLGIWTRTTKQSKRYPHALVRPFFGFEVPRWTSDSQSVVVKLVASSTLTTHGLISPNTDEITITVFSYTPGSSSTGATTLPGWADGYLCDLGRVNVNTGELQKLAEDWRILGWKLSPDGRSVAALRYIEAEPTLQQFYFDLSVLPLDGAPSQVIAHRIPQEYGVCFNWSPDSRWLAYTTQERGKRSSVFVVAADGSAEPQDLSDDALDMHLLGEIESPRWNRDSTQIYCLSNRGLWEITLHEYVSPKATTRRHIVIEGDFRVCGWAQSPLTTILYMTHPDHLCLMSRNLHTKDIALIDLEISSGHSSILAELPQRLQCPACEIEVSQRGGGQEGEAYFVLQGSNHPAELYRFKWNQRLNERILSLNPALSEVAVGTSRLLEFRALDGHPGLAALLLPPTYKEGDRIPIVVEVYGGAMNANGLHDFGVTQDILHGQILVNHGYGLLLPDMPMQDHNPLTQLPRYVLPAITRLIDLGIADPKRIGIMGQSYGGYSTLALLTQTQIFSAAVACAGTYNLVASYFTLSQDGNDEWLGWCESGQGRMGGSVWEKRPAYIENSPLFYLDRITTPVLLICGGQDPGAPEQAAAAFIGLRRLNKKVEYRCYQEEGHWSGTWRESSYRDLCECTLAWFDNHLTPNVQEKPAICAIIQEELFMIFYPKGERKGCFEAKSVSFTKEKNSSTLLVLPRMKGLPRHSPYSAI